MAISASISYYITFCKPFLNKCNFAHEPAECQVYQTSSVLWNVAYFSLLLSFSTLPPPSLSLAFSLSLCRSLVRFLFISTRLRHHHPSLPIKHCGLSVILHFISINWIICLSTYFVRFLQCIALFLQLKNHI